MERWWGGYGWGRRGPFGSRSAPSGHRKANAEEYTPFPKRAPSREIRSAFGAAPRGGRRRRLRRKGHELSGEICGSGPVCFGLRSPRSHLGRRRGGPATQRHGPAATRRGDGTRRSTPRRRRFSDARQAARCRFAIPRIWNSRPAYVREEFTAAGASVADQPYSARGRSFRNVIARIGPEAPGALVIGAHYDAFGDTNANPGADDNASGVGGLLGDGPAAPGRAPRASPSPRRLLHGGAALLPLR